MSVVTVYARKYSRAWYWFHVFPRLAPVGFPLNRSSDWFFAFAPFAVIGQISRSFISTQIYRTLGRRKRLRPVDEEEQEESEMKPESKPKEKKVGPAFLSLHGLFSRRSNAFLRISPSKKLKLSSNRDSSSLSLFVSFQTKNRIPFKFVSIAVGNVMHETINKTF